MARQRFDPSALNRFQQKCFISGREMSTADDSQPDDAAVAQLVARRWKADHRYVALHAKNSRAGLQAHGYDDPTTVSEWRNDISSYPTAYAGPRLWGGPYFGSNVDVHQYQEGTLGIDIFDTHFSDLS